MNDPSKKGDQTPKGQPSERKPAQSAPGFGGAGQVQSGHGGGIPGAAGPHGGGGQGSKSPGDTSYSSSPSTSASSSSSASASTATDRPRAQGSPGYGSQGSSSKGYGATHSEHTDPWRDRPETGSRERTGSAWDDESTSRAWRTQAYAASRQGSGNGRSRPVMETLRELAGDVGLLARQEVELARAEINEKLDQTKKGVAELGMGAAFAYAGFLFVLGAAALGLDLAIGRLWLSTLIIGGIVLLIGGAMLATARSNLKARNLTLERTARSLREDVEMARHETRRTHL